MEIIELTRVFKYNSLDLEDPGPAMSAEQVRDFYANLYPEIVSAAIEGPEQRDDKLVYTFRRAVGTKGAKEPKSTGAELIATERARQIKSELFSARHDDQHQEHELALAACAYAAPKPIFIVDQSDTNQITFTDPFPESWDFHWDGRPRDENTSELIPAAKMNIEVRVRCLVKAGALIAAEIDRLNRVRNRGGK